MVKVVDDACREIPLIRKMGESVADLEVVQEGGVGFKKNIFL